MAGDKRPGFDEVLRENEELRYRLEEAEETIRAIQTGQVDAFVVTGAERDQVFTLETADRPYRLFVETMQQGAVRSSIRNREVPSSLPPGPRTAR